MTPKPVHHDRMSERSIKIEATSREHVQGWCGKGGDGQAGEWQWRNNTVNVAPPRCVHTTFPTTRPTLLSWYSQSFSTQLSYLMTYSISTQHGFTKVQSPLLVASGHCTQALSSYPTGQAPQLWLNHNKDNGCILLMKISFNFGPPLYRHQFSLQCPLQHFVSNTSNAIVNWISSKHLTKNKIGRGPIKKTGR